MVLRVEYILILALAIISIFIFIEKPSDIRALESNSSKEVYFKNFTLVEIDESGIKNQLIATEAIKYKNSFNLFDINITYQNSDNLTAKRATYIKDLIYLEDGVVLKRDDNFKFQTDDLYYRLKDKILYTDRDFILNMNGSRVSGSRLRYNLDTKYISANSVNASIQENIIAKSRK